VVFLLSDDVPEISVQVTQVENKWDKRHACKFCGKLYLKIARHLETCHGNEPEVQNALQNPKKSPARKEAWASIRNEGNFDHNFKVLKEKRGLVIPKYRRKLDKKHNHTDYLPCEFCKALYVAKELNDHQKRCTKRTKSKLKRNEAVRGGRLLLPITDEENTSFFVHVVNSMKDDEVAKLARNDKLIMTFGKRKWQKKDVEEHTANFVSSKMRELARLVLRARRMPNSNIHCVEDCIVPKNFTETINAVKKVAGFDESLRKYRTPSLALNLGYSLKKCAKILTCEGLMEDDKSKETHGKTFQELYDAMWAESISSGALQTIDKNKSNKVKLLPLCEDVQTLFAHVRNKSAELRKKVGTEPSAYPEFVRYTLCEMTMFNRKRGGEVQRMKVTDVTNALKETSSVPDKEVELSLSVTEVKLCRIMKRVELRGKFGLRVALILTPNMLSNIATMMKVREKANVEGNYLFCRPNSNRPYRGADALSECVREVDLKQPEGFTWTGLRKHLATLSQVYEISETSQDQLAQFMGHSIRVHRDFYRLPLDVVQRAKVAKVLLDANLGRHHPPSKFEDITVDSEGE